MRTPRPFLAALWQPQALAPASRDLERRFQRLERAPVKFSLERVIAPRRAPSAASPIILHPPIIVPAGDLFPDRYFSPRYFPDRYWQ